MGATISVVAATRPEGLLEAAARQATSIAAINSAIDLQQGAMARLRSGWEGSAAAAAQARADKDLARQRQLVGRLAATSAVLGTGGTSLAALRTQILSLMTQASALGGLVSDDGTVRPMGPNMLMTPTLAGAYTTTLKTLLRQFDAVDQSTAQALNTAFAMPETPPAPDFRWTEKDLYDGDPLSDDVNQDAIGDCYLISTMAAVAHADPQRIRDRIAYNPQTGEFDVTLWDGGTWRHISVTQADIDANIKARGGSAVDNYPSAGKPLWPAVLESAYAKLKGTDLKGIETGRLAPWAMEALTGNDGKWVIPATEWFTTQHIDTQITDALHNHQPVTVSTSLFGGDLQSRHVYSVEGISGTGSDAVVTLRNPWGADNGQSVITTRLGDLVGTNPLGGLGLGPVGMFNIGQM
jgi:uncharacterized protein YukE